MIKNVHLGKEIVINILDKIGVLADMAKIIAEHGLNIEAVSGTALDRASASIAIVTDDNLRAIEALWAKGYKSAIEREVVVLELENKAGALKAITSRLAAKGIDINHMYGTTCLAKCPSRMVLSTSDNEKALIALR